MTEIKPSYVTFEQAKKLKEKNFNEKCPTLYNERGEDSGTKMGMNFLPNNYVNYYSRPEQWQVVEWLRVVHGIWVYCEINGDRYYCKAKKLKSNWRRVVSGVVNNENTLYNSPQEAYSAAFDYVLNNLI